MGNSTSKSKFDPSKTTSYDDVIKEYKQLLETFNRLLAQKEIRADVTEFDQVYDTFNLKHTINEMEILLLNLFFQCLQNDAGIDWLTANDDPENRGWPFLAAEAYFIFNAKTALSLREENDVKDYVEQQLTEYMPSLQATLESSCSRPHSVSSIVMVSEPSVGQSLSRHSAIASTSASAAIVLADSSSSSNGRDLVAAPREHRSVSMPVATNTPLSSRSSSSNQQLTFFPVQPENHPNTIIKFRGISASQISALVGNGIVDKVRLFNKLDKKITDFLSTLISEPERMQSMLNSVYQSLLYRIAKSQHYEKLYNLYQDQIFDKISQECREIAEKSSQQQKEILTQVLETDEVNEDPELKAFLSGCLHKLVTQLSAGENVMTLALSSTTSDDDDPELQSYLSAIAASRNLM